MQCSTPVELSLVMADNQNQAVGTKYVLTNAQLIGWVRKLQQLELANLLVRQEQAQLEKDLNKNRAEQQDILQVITSHMKARGKHREIVFLDKSQPQAALIEHQGFNMYPNSPVSVIFLDDPVR